MALAFFLHSEALQGGFTSCMQRLGVFSPEAHLCPRNPVVVCLRVLHAAMLNCATHSQECSTSGWSALHAVLPDSHTWWNCCTLLGWGRCWLTAVDRMQSLGAAA